jgi:hypothetical protein
MEVKDFKQLQDKALINYLWSHKYWNYFLRKKGCFYYDDGPDSISSIKQEDLGDGCCRISWGIDRGHFDCWMTEEFTSTYEELINSIDSIGANWRIQQIEKELHQLKIKESKLNKEFKELSKTI